MYQILEKDLTEGHNSEQPTSKRLRQEVYSQEEKVRFKIGIKLQGRQSGRKLKVIIVHLWWLP